MTEEHSCRFNDRPLYVGISEERLWFFSMSYCTADDDCLELALEVVKAHEV